MYLEANGFYRTDSLFVERIAKRHKEKGTEPEYSLSERLPKEDDKNLYQLFLDSADEYDFAIKAFGAKGHLDKLKEISWFMKGWPGCRSFRGYEAWLDDMQERDASIGKKVLIEKAQDGDVTAAKKLIDLHKQTASKGRPKKEDIAKEAAKKAEEDDIIEDSLKRLNVIKLRG
tara:strand:+ start:68 stop:586 length:519 start_codon:yes stop_codon:yes gene_type:complete